MPVARSAITICEKAGLISASDQKVDPAAPRSWLRPGSNFQSAKQVAGTTREIVHVEIGLIPHQPAIEKFHRHTITFWAFVAGIQENEVRLLFVSVPIKYWLGCFGIDRPMQAVMGVKSCSRSFVFSTALAPIIPRYDFSCSVRQCWSQALLPHIGHSTADIEQVTLVATGALSLNCRTHRNLSGYD